MPAIAQSDSTQRTEFLSKGPRVICYHQTHYHDGKFVSILPLLETSVTHIIVAAIHINSRDHLTLNNDPYDHPKHEPLWAEVHTFQEAGVKVLGMLGGAAKGTYTRLDSDSGSFEAHYALLHQMVLRTKLDGLDLDVEEPMSLAGIIRLIDRLKLDFGQNFLITLAPVAHAMKGLPHLSGFDYWELEKAFGRHIAWYNTQFYCGWGWMMDSTDYEQILMKGWPINKIVVGVVTNPANGNGWVSDDLLFNTLAVLNDYPDFGGVMGWEYFNAMTETDGHGKPWCWAQFMGNVLRPAYSSE
jgi:hypothetical protein